MLALIIFQVLTNPDMIVVVVFVIPAIVLPASIWLWLSIRRTSIGINDGIVHWHKVVRHGTFALSDVGGIQSRTMWTRPKNYGVLIVRDRTGRVLMRFNPALFPLSSCKEILNLLQHGRA